MKKGVSIILLLLFVSFPAVASLLLPGGFTSHDLTHHVIRQIDMDRLLSEGQFPPRWSGDLATGFGYPLFLFNYPLPALAGEIFHKVGFSFLYSVKAVLFSSMILSVLGMYLFLKSFLGSPRACVDVSRGEADSRLPAFLGAVFYLYAPIRFLNVYVAASVGSALAIGILPFVFWSIVEIKKGKEWAILVGALSVSGLILAHNVTALIFAPVILTFAWVIGGIRGIKKIGIMFLLGLGLSAWFWLPAMGEKQFIRYDQLMRRIYVDQFPTLSQIIYSPWGYGLSHPQNPESGDMSYQLGLVHIGVVLVYGIWYLAFGRRNKFKRLSLFILASFVISIFLMLKISQPIWDALPFLSLVQFPWRFMAVSIFMAAVATALLVNALPHKKLLVISLLLLVIYANRNHLRINQKYDPGEDYYLSLKTSATSFDENLPIWVTKIKTDADHGKFSFLSGKGSVNTIESKSARVLVEIEATESAEVRFNQYYFPGWDIEMDGEKVNFNYLTVDNSGLPVFDIAEGKHLVTAEFKNTPIRNIADGISVITVIIIVICRLLILR